MRHARALPALVLALALTAPRPAQAGMEADERASFGPGVRSAPAEFAEISEPPVFSALALPVPTVEIVGLVKRKPRSIVSKERERTGMPVLSAARARILLRSLTVPGWGQATLGRRGAAKMFAIAEAGVWGTFAAFRIQEQMRRQSYERTARELAGIDLRGRDEEYRRMVGSFLSSDEYNLFVVFRDAANQFYENPVRYREYIAEHSLRGRDTWHWSNLEDLFRYRAQRKDAQRAAQRANAAVAVAIVNRFLSAVHAARLAGRPAPESRSWNIEVAPAGGGDPTDLRLAVRTRF